VQLINFYSFNLLAFTVASRLTVPCQFTSGVCYYWLYL